MVGETIAHYQILEKLGEGGMGEVYRAEDSHLGRQVAIKLLPDAFTGDPERLARFAREARLLASLNHPGIAAIYGLEEAGGKRFLVMELVEGMTLAERLRKGPLPMEEALEACRQVADGLEAAHEKGVIHRDLKPANVMMTGPASGRPGKAKILDFGLAKAIADEASPADASQSPTITEAMTRPGVVLGTAAYMSPKQARSKPVDRRADTWAFGCVLYEMLTGKRAFPGESVPDIMAAILRTEPDWSLLPPDTPAAIRTLLRCCLHKNPSHRLQHIGDARVVIEGALSEPAPSPGDLRVSVKPRRFWLGWAVAGLMAAAAIAALWAPWRMEPPPAPVQRLAVELPPEDPFAIRQSWNPNVAISADGTRLAYVSDRGTTTRLLVRNMDEREFKPLAGTEEALSPFFSPDGQWIGFFANGKLKKMPVNGGAAEVVCFASTFAGYGAVWEAGGTILFVGDFQSGLWRVPAAGGSPQAVLTPDPTKNIFSYAFPQLLPAHAGLLMTVKPGSIASFDEAQLAWQPDPQRSPNVILSGGSCGRMLPNGYLVYSHRQTLMAVPFRPALAKVARAGVPVVDRVITRYTTGAAQFAFSDSGTLAYAHGADPEVKCSLVSVNRQGVGESILDSPYYLMDLSLSPDGRQLAISTLKANDDVHLYDLRRGTFTRFTFEGGDKQTPVWTPDGTRLAYNAARGRVANIYWKPVDSGGAPEPVLTSENRQVPHSFSPDGKLLAYVEVDPSTGKDIWVAAVQGDRKPQPFLRTPFEEGTPRFSPDGRWLAFTSNEAGESRVYVARYPGGGSKRQVSSGPGRDPLWSSSGRELFYWDGIRLMAVGIATQPELDVGQPQKLFEFPQLDAASPYAYTPTRDGQRFLIVRQAQVEPLRQLNVVLNWFDDVKRKVEAAGK